MSRILAIAVNTFREAIRDRILYALLGSGVVAILFALLLSALSLNQEARVVEDLGLAAVSLFSVWTSIFLGSSLLYKEIERKTLYVILPKPISRTEFLLGKYLGILLTTFVYVAVMSSMLLGVLAVQRGLAWSIWLPMLCVAAGVFAFGAWRIPQSTALLLPYGVFCVGLAIVCARLANVPLGLPLSSAILALGEVALVSAIAVFFSSFSTPVLTGLFTFGVWILGRSADDMASLRSSHVPASLRAALHGVARVIPNLDLFVPGRHAIETLGDGVVRYVGTTLGYGALCVVLLLSFSAVIFQRRDLT